MLYLVVSSLIGTITMYEGKWWYIVKNRIVHTVAIPYGICIALLTEIKKSCNLLSCAEHYGWKKCWHWRFNESS
jgi:hypothetical protein